MQMSKPDWQYGDAGDRYPVTPNTLWAAGPHLLACGDLTTPHYTALLNPARVGAIRIPLVYVDPPWNQGLLTGFRTKAKAPVSELTFTEFLIALLRPLTTIHPRPPQPTILMEGSTQAKAMEAVTDAIDDIPDLVCRATWNITYSKTKPGILYELGAPSSEPLRTSFHSMDDVDTPAHAIEHYTEPGNFVLDPCLGRGLTAVAAQTLSRRCIGMELHPRRLACTLDTLHKDHDLRIDPSGALIETKPTD